jgi:hypothetical protein
MPAQSLRAMPNFICNTISANEVSREKPIKVRFTQPLPSKLHVLAHKGAKNFTLFCFFV